MSKKDKSKYQELKLHNSDIDLNKSKKFKPVHFLNNILCMAVQESHQLIAFIDVYETIQVYNLFYGSVITAFSNKVQKDEINSRVQKDNMYKNLYYALHFIENSNTIVFINSYRNEAWIYKFTDAIKLVAQVHLPDGFAASCSIEVKDKNTILVGNTVGTVYMLSAKDARFFSKSFSYDNIESQLRSLSSSIKNAQDSPIFASYVTGKEIDQDRTIIWIDVHPYAESKFAVAYAYNLVILYDFDKERIDWLYDVGSSYNSLFADKPPITLYNIPSVIKDARYNVDSHKFLVAVDIGKIFIYKNGKSKYFLNLS